MQTRLWWSWQIYCQQQTTLSLFMPSMMKSPVTLSLLLPPHVRHSFFPLCLLSTSERQDIFSGIDKIIISHLLFAAPLPPPLSVQFPMVTHSMMRVSWVPGDTDVPGHRITYSTNHGSDVKQVNTPVTNYKPKPKPELRFETYLNSILLSDYVDFNKGNYYSIASGVYDII